MLTLLCAVLLTFGGPSPNPPEYSLTVSAGDVDRIQSVVSFELPADLVPPLVAVDEEGEPSAVQVLAGRGWFVLDTLPAGASRTYRLQAGDHPPSTTLSAQRQHGALTLSLNGAPVLVYRADIMDPPHAGVDHVYRRGGYIHPVLTPSGVPITNDFPRNHLHHHGIWAAWTKTVFQGRTPDFWNMGAGTGTVLPVALDTTWSGPVVAGFRSRHRYVDLSASEPVDVLHESWDVRVYAVDAGYFLFDIRLIHTTATDSALFLPEYRYGGLGFRGHGDWEGPEHTFFLTSEGKDRSNGHATRARWCHIGGYVGGRLAGAGILGHPNNFRAPQPMRIHPTEPFFNWAPSQAGDWAITPDRPFDATYRFVVTDGPPDRALLDRLWADFARPVTVTLARAE